MFTGCLFSYRAICGMVDAKSPVVRTAAGRGPPTDHPKGVCICRTIFCARPAYDGRIRAFFATTRGTVNEAASIHRTTPVMSAALGRLLTAGAIMGLNLKNDDDRITLQIKGDGPGGGVLVTADRQGHVKGYPHNPQVVIPKKPNGKLDVGGALGHGTLTVIMDMGFGDPYVSAMFRCSRERSPRISPTTMPSRSRPPRSSRWGCWSTGIIRSSGRAAL